MVRSRAKWGVSNHEAMQVQSRPIFGLQTELAE
jgi:hypothetical protein